MKLKNLFEERSKTRVNNSLRRITNLLGEKGQGLVDELRAIFDEFETAEGEISDDELTAKIEEIVGKYKEIPEAVANAIASVNAEVLKVKNALNNGVNSKHFSKEVKNEICKAILNSRNKQEAKDAVEKVLVKNDITGLTFGDVISYEIVDNWGDKQGVYGQFTKTPISKFFYTEQDLETASILAKQWNKNSASAKEVQQIVTNGKKIDTAYIYKRQRVANEDLDAINAQGGSADFLNYITNELRRQWANTVIKEILCGKVGEGITTFEKIGSKTTDDIFTTIKHPEQAGDVEFGDLWRLVQTIENPDGKAITLFVDGDVLASASAFKYADGGTTDYRGLDDLKTKLGVADIVKFPLKRYEETGGLYAVAIIPEEYYVREVNEIEIAYPQFDLNAQNWQYEKNAGGAIRGLKSTAVLRQA